METNELIEKFENGTLLEEQFHHIEHLQVTAWYLKNYSELDAILRIKQGIMKYNLLYGVPQSDERGYHETITMFFIRMVQNVIQTNPGLNVDQTVEELLKDSSDSKSVLRRYFSRERLLDVHARKYWVEPDLKSF